MTFGNIGKASSGVCGICMVFRWYNAHLESVFVS